MKDKIFSKESAKLAIILIVLITGLVYANSLKNSFVWDDYVVIVDNNFVKSWKNFPTIFSKAYLSPFIKKGCCFFVDSSIGSGETSYRPIVTLSYFFDYSLWKLNAFGYHLTNLLLHITNAVLLYFLTNLIVKNKKVALSSSLLFALHPVNSEAINVISFREDLLAFLFYLSSFILYIKLNKYHGIKRIYFYIFSLILFFLALFSKEMSITLPLVLILYDYFFVFKEKLKGILGHFNSYYLGYIVILLFYLWVHFFVIVNITEPPVEYPGGNFYSNTLTMSKVIATYIKWIFFPINIPAIMPNQPYLISNSLFDPWVLFSMMLIITCFFIVIKIYKSSKEFSFVILWFFITLLPVSNILPISNYIASRYLYIPVVGFCFLVAMSLVKPIILKTPWLSLNLPQKVIRDIVIILLAFYSIVTFIRNIAWKNNTVFHLAMVERYPNNALAHFGLGTCFKNSGLLDKAVSEYKTAIRLNTELVEAYNNLGIIFGDTERYKEAIDCFRQTIKIDPKNLQAYDNLAVTYTRIKKWEEARKTWEKALEISPEFEAAQNNLKKLRELGY